LGHVPKNTRIPYSRWESTGSTGTFAWQQRSSDLQDEEGNVLKGDWVLGGALNFNNNINNIMI